MIQASQLYKLYQMGHSVVRALDGVDLNIDDGEFLSITGASGSGKSTLMHILGCLDRPTAGSLEIRGRNINEMNEKQLAKVRNQHIGFVFQTFNLINRTTALDNVIVPLMYTRQWIDRKKAKQALERVGLAGRTSHTPAEMSGGECQRVSIARAIVNNPGLILADEPTGNLDSQTSDQILQIFHQLRADGITIVLVTHEMDIAVQADRMVHMKDGKIVEDTAVDEHRRADIIKKERDAHDKAFRRKSLERTSRIHNSDVSKPMQLDDETISS